MLFRSGGVIDIARAAKSARVKLPFDANCMISLVASGKKGLTAIDREVVNQATALAFNHTFQLTMFLALLMIPCLNLLRRPKRPDKS